MPSNDLSLYFGNRVPLFWESCPFILGIVSLYFGNRPFILGIACIDHPATRVKDGSMNIAQIEEAVHRRVPFKLKLADGDEYEVPHPNYIFLPPKAAAKRTFAMVCNDQGFASILPLLTITSLTFQIDAHT
jgi:hypothetical protein